MSDDPKARCDRARVVRRANRGVVTKLVKEVDEIIGTDRLTAEGSARLKVIFKQLNGKATIISEFDREIYSLCEESEVEREVEEAENITAKIIDDKRRIDDALNQTIGSDSTTDGASPVIRDPAVFARAKLPKLVLPHFKGDVTKWTSFWDSFDSAVHQNAHISKIDKFNYLHSLLDGAAATAVQGLALNELNYDSAVELLKERFGKPKNIIAAHMDELLKVPTCTSERAASLRQVYDKINVHIRGLASLGIDSDQYGSLLIPVIMSKISSEMRLRAARESGNDDAWKLDELMKVIKSEVEARETSEGARVGQHKQLSHDSVHPKQPKNPYLPSASALVSNDYKVRCAYCEGSHYSASCDKVRAVTERKDILTKAGKCFNCLRTNHKVKDCRSTRTCRFCNRRHHQSICTQQPDTQSSQEVKRTQQPTSTDEIRKDTTANCSTVCNEKTILLQTAQAIASNPVSGQYRSVRILFDSGSQRSYITEELSQQLRLKPDHRERLQLNTFGDTHHKVRGCNVVNLDVLKIDHTDSVNINALCFPTICTNLPSVVDVHDHPHLVGLELADDPDQPRDRIDVLIGSDFYWDIVTGEMKMGEKGPIALSSRLGWLLSGPIESMAVANLASSYMIVVEGMGKDDTPMNNDQLTELLKRFWETESLGVNEIDTNGNDNFISNIEFIDGHYQISLPWKTDETEIPDHYSLSLNRLKFLQRRLLNKPDLLREYDKVIKEQLARGIIERVNDVNTPAPKALHYLPHHAIVRQERETTKIRVVYDGSAKDKGESLSLNDCLHTGPNYIPLLFDVLVRFRSYTIAITADIEKAFLMIHIAEKDRDSLRFLWFEDPFSCDSRLIQFRFSRLVFGLRPAPAILGVVIAHHLDKFETRDPHSVELLRESLYVDDLVAGVDSVEEGVQFYRRSKQIMLEAGMNLRKWQSSSPSLSQQIQLAESEFDSIQVNLTVTQDSNPENLQIKTFESTNSPSQVSKLLGLLWDSRNDCFRYDFTALLQFAKDITPSKRALLRITAKIFDPLGFLSPFVIQLKVMFQQLCIDGKNWDAEITGKLLEQWKKILSDMQSLYHIEVPRYYHGLSDKPVSIELHGFSDASISAYAAVLYIRTCFENGRVEVSIIASKTKVTPIKQQTIPRLELMAALLLSKLVNNTVRILSFTERIYCWTDSTCVLYWIQNNKPWKQFVSHRVREIHQSTDKSIWRHCPGVMNPADLPSRGITALELVNSRLWWHGPAFLQLTSDKWPTHESLTFDSSVSCEMIKDPPVVSHVLLTTHDTEQPSNLDKVMNIKRFSSLTKLLRVTAFVFRFVNKVLKRDNQEANGFILLGSELKEAKACWIKSIQASQFESELQSIIRNRQSGLPIRVKQFGLFLGADGMLRCRGRLGNSNLSLSSKEPIILSSNHHFVELLVLDAHLKSKHCGISETISTLREDYWILKIRVVVKRVIRRCVTCLRFEGVPFSTGQSPDLPSIRVSEDPPFSHTGIDFAGPVYVQSSSTQIKTYICLFTCASTRGIHLELTTGLDVQSFLLAFRRFSSRRGLPNTLISDNATTFRSSAKEITSICRSPEVLNYFSNRQISWKFIIEKAPWWGGFWERMIKTVKQSLKKSIGRSLLQYDELNTVLIEIEAIVNTRPLTYVEDGENSLTYSLTPSHLINGRRISTSNSQHQEIISTHQTLTKRHKFQRRLLKQFTTIWRKQYLLQLRESHALKLKKQGKHRPIEVDDMVILKDESTKRAFWKLARVKELITGRDKQVRAAVIELPDSSRCLRRSVTQLIPLELTRSDTPANS